MPLDHGARVASAAFSRDGRWVFTTTHARTLHLWDARGGQEVSPRRRLLGRSPQLLVTGSFVLAMGAPGSGGIHSFCLEDLRIGAGSSLQRDAQRVLAEVVAGQRIEGSGIHNLTDREWLARFEALRDSLREPPRPGGAAYRR